MVIGLLLVLAESYITAATNVPALTGVYAIVN
eukprot:COSAG04_NODE_19740_length_409_cov_0.838710_1_plen_31_part_10